ncbi:hypothetical protein MNBD_GAMMA08-2902 [hydrothermal vent metagenome]|uniref:Uncharacterized protein n=1 Tax=hydrothermal vent metagenome TaxID=652676 RepID=A0A3B0WTA2_9ZZZZ
MLTALSMHRVLADESPVAISKKEVLSALIKNADVLLKDGAYCDNVGTTEDDLSIGDYISGFWAFQATTKGKNWIEVTTSKLTEHVYLAKVTILRNHGEEEWGWGVSFKIDDNKNVNRHSFTCTGGG